MLNFFQDDNSKIAWLTLDSLHLSTTLKSKPVYSEWKNLPEPMYAVSHL